MKVARKLRNKFFFENKEQRTENRKQNKERITKINQIVIQ